MRLLGRRSSLGPADKSAAHFAADNPGVVPEMAILDPRTGRLVRGELPLGALPAAAEDALMKPSAINFQDKFARFSETWSPKVIASSTSRSPPTNVK